MKTVIKTSIWFVISLGLSVLIVWGFTDDIEVGVYVALASNFGKSIIYYGYEKAWIWWGQTRGIIVSQELDEITVE